MSEILYSRFNFILPVSDSDKYITIADINGVKRYNITPINVTATFALGLFIKIKTIGTDKIIALKFANANEAFLALQKLQQALDKFTQTNQGGLSDDDKIYINNQINIEIGRAKYEEHFTDESTWVVNHNFGDNSLYYQSNPNHKPSVLVVDDDGYECEGYITFVDVNTLTIEFGQSISGYVYLN